MRIATWLQSADSSPVTVPKTGTLGWAVSLKHFLVSSCRRTTQPSNSYVKIKPFVHNSCFHRIFLRNAKFSGFLLHT